MNHMKVHISFSSQAHKNEAFAFLTLCSILFKETCIGFLKKIMIITNKRPSAQNLVQQFLLAIFFLLTYRSVCTRHNQAGKLPSNSAFHSVQRGPHCSCEYRFGPIGRLPWRTFSQKRGYYYSCTRSFLYITSLFFFFFSFCWMNSLAWHGLCFTGLCNVLYQWLSAIDASGTTSGPVEMMGTSSMA